MRPLKPATAAFALPAAEGVSGPPDRWRGTAVTRENGGNCSAPWVRWPADPADAGCGVRGLWLGWPG